MGTPTPQGQVEETTARRVGGAGLVPNRIKRRTAAWRTKLKEKVSVDDNHHMLPALVDLEPPKAKVVLRPGLERQWTAADSEVAGCLGGWSGPAVMGLC